MADFLQAYERLILNEGGYVLTNTKNDRGGLTYAGITRKNHPAWAGWDYIDRGVEPPAEMVREFYRQMFWSPILGDQIAHQRTAIHLLDFSVNAGITVATRLAQLVVGTTPDGAMGPKTVEALNAMDPAVFSPLYTLAKIARYRDIVARDKTQLGFLVGWINRSLREAA